MTFKTFFGAFFWSAAVGVFWACQKMEPLDFSNLSISNVFETGLKTGEMQGDFVLELSGMAASRRHLGLFWAHGDGKVKTIFLIDSLGNRLASLPLPETVDDLEDIASGWSSDGQPILFVGDIGDNDGTRKTHRILRIVEPEWPAGQVAPAQFLMPETLPTLDFEYPDGLRTDAETLLFDSISSDLLVATKGKAASVFVFSKTAQQKLSATLEKLVELPIEKATGGDISGDGQEILIKNKTQVFYWKLGPNETFRSVLSQKAPEFLPYHTETQGEAIAFNVWQTGFFTSTERANAAAQPIWFYARK